jgi:hypothetical protein
MPLVFSIVNRLRTALLYGRAGRLTAVFGDFWPARAVFGQEGGRKWGEGTLSEWLTAYRTNVTLLNIIWSTNSKQTVTPGLGRIVALYHRSSTLYQLH